MDSAGDSAGDFSTWLTGALASTRQGQASDVPCGTCTACCTSAMFVLIEPEEHAARAVIPQELLVPAPGMPEGYSLMGYDAQGRCPMLGSQGCTIYDARPRTCRVYDCRLLAATDQPVSGARQEALAARVATWRFETATEADEVQMAALRAAGRYLQDSDAAPDFDRGRAVLALAVHDLFWTQGPDGRAHLIDPDGQAVEERIRHVIDS